MKVYNINNEEDMKELAKKINGIGKENKNLFIKKLSKLSKEVSFLFDYATAYINDNIIINEITKITINDDKIMFEINNSDVIEDIKMVITFIYKFILETDNGKNVIIN